MTAKKGFQAILEALKLLVEPRGDRTPDLGIANAALSHLS